MVRRIHHLGVILAVYASRVAAMMMRILALMASHELLSMRSRYGCRFWSGSARDACWMSLYMGRMKASVVMARVVV